MPTPPTTVEDYCALLVRSRLLLGEEVEEAYRRFLEQSAAQGKSATDVDRFRRFLVRQKLLTDYQAHMILRGRADGFFIGSYKILERIGSGHLGVGGVYKALHHLGQLVALKILPASRAADPPTLARFQREARLLLQLDHPNVVRAFELGEVQGVHYLVMEYLEGETLQDVLNRRKRLPWPEALRLIYQALQGLQHLHERHMVHRDLKPANLMLVHQTETSPTGQSRRPKDKQDEDNTWNCTLKIVDIGLGRELFDDAVPEGQIETQLTQEGSILGTPDYMAPEQARDASGVDIRSDIYSLGCVLYHCLTGQPPFPDTNIMAQMVRHAMEPPKPLQEFIPNAPLMLQTVLDTMLAKQPQDRYSTPAAAAAALQPLLSQRGTQPAAAAVNPAYSKWLESQSSLPAAPMTQPPSSGVHLSSPLREPTAATAVKPIAVPIPPPPLQTTAAATGLIPPFTAPPQVPLPSPPAPIAPDAAAHAAPNTAPMIEVDVELVTPHLANMYGANVEDRPLLQLSRRDWVMLSLGAAATLVATGIGYGLARMLRPKPTLSPQ
jgi:serine/threonine protein kinase